MSASSPPATWRNGSSCGWSTCCAGTSWTASRWCCSTPMARASAAAGIPTAWPTAWPISRRPRPAPRSTAPASSCGRRWPSRAATATCCSARRNWPRRPIAGIAAHAFAPPGPVDDPVYAEADYVADFFATVRREMQALVADPGYAALLGAFGPALLDRTGSRPAVRQSTAWAGRCGSATPAAPRHPEQRHPAAARLDGEFDPWARHRRRRANPDAFQDLRARSPRFRRALAMAARASACSDIGVLRAVVDTLDPGPWLDRAGFTRRPGRREALLASPRGRPARPRCADAGGCSAGCRPTTWRCAPPGRSCR